MAKERFDYIDIARGLGILMVVWAHIAANNATVGFIYTFHMPLFFFISGMMFNRVRYIGFKDFALKRVKRLFVPYVLYSIASWAIWFAFNYVTHRQVDSYFMPLLQTILAQGSGQFFVYNSPLWFVPCLFAVEIMYFFLSRFSSIVILVISILISLLSITFEHVWGENYLYMLPWNFDAAMMALPFYAVGNIICRRWSLAEIKSFVMAHKAVMIVICFLITALIYWSLDVFGSPSMGYSYYHDERIFHIRAILGSAMVIVLSVFIEAIPGRIIDYIKWLGRVSLDVMCTHVPLKGVLIVIIAMILGVTTEDVSSLLPYAIVVFTLTMIIDSVIVWLIRPVTARVSR